MNLSMLVEELQVVGKPGFGRRLEGQCRSLSEKKKRWGRRRFTGVGVGVGVGG